MIKVTYYLGLNDQNTKKQHFDMDSARVLIAQVLNNNGYPSATLYNADGLWMGDYEATIVIELLLYEHQVNNDSLVTVAHTLGKVFNQYAILVTKAKLEDMTLVIDNEL